MRSLSNTRIGVRTQAAGVIGMIMFWCWSVWLGAHAGKGFVSNLSLFWNAVFSWMPFIALVFMAVLVFTYFRSGRRHLWWLVIAIGSALFPWFLFIVYLVEGGFL
jgi:hypothetical protein